MAHRNKTMKSITFFIEKEEKERLEKEAREQGRSLSAHIAFLVKKDKA